MKAFAGRIIRYFFNGTLFIVPLVATVYFVVEAFQWLDSRLALPYPGVGFLIIFSVITFFGYLTSNYAFAVVTQWFDHGLNRIPLVKIVYSSIKDLMGAFVGEKRKFSKPVLVQLDTTPALHRIGFITQSDLKELGLHDMVMVYFPQSYTFAGDLFVVARENIKPLNISGTVAMKFIVSGGVSGLQE